MMDDDAVGVEGLREAILRLAYKRNMIGIGISVYDEEVINSLLRAERYANLLAFATSEAGKALEERGIDVIISEQPDVELVQAIGSEIDGAVRGTLSARKVLSEIGKRGFPIERAVLLAHHHVELFLIPVGIDEGEKVDERIELAIKTASLVRTLGEYPRIAILSGGRLEDRGRSAKVDTTLKEADEVTDALTAYGIDVEHIGILIEKVAKKFNVLVAPDGITGNIVFRTLTFLGGWESWGAPLLTGLEKKFVYVDSSRTNMRYDRQIALASALCTLYSKKKVEE